MRAIVALYLLLPSIGFSQQPPPASGAPIVFFDIAGPDTAQLRSFYQDVFGWTIASDGSFSTAVAAPIPAVLRSDPAETILYFGVEHVTATLALIVEKGGAVAAQGMEVPGVVVLGLFMDPAGNRVVLVEMQDGQPKVP